jgi:hypothetical protein
MPNIRQVEAPALGLNPSSLGTDSASGAARRLGGFYNQEGGATQELGQETSRLGSQVDSMYKSLGKDAGSAIQTAGDVYVKYEDHKEISHGAAVASDMFVNLENQWNETLKNADPNDPSAAAKFKETVLQPALDKFTENFTTENSQKYAEGIVDRYRSHFDTKTAADMSTMAGIAAKQNATQTINSLSSAVYLDPSSLGAAIDTLKHSSGSIVDSSPTIDAETGAKVKAELNQKGIESLVKSAVSGMIQKNPNIDLDAIQKKYPEYINGGELKMFQKAAQTQAKVDAYHDKSAAIAQRQLDDQQVHNNATKVISNNVSVDPQTNQVTINPKFFNDALEIARKNPDAPSAAATVRTMLDWGESQLNKERKVTTDPAATSAIDANMFSDNPTTKMDLLKLEAAGKLTRSDAEIRSKIIDQRDKLPADPQFKFAMDGAKELIEGRTSGEKSLQAGKYAAFMQQFLSDYQRQKAAGTLPPNALSLRDPNSMLSKAMEAYKSPLAAAIGGNGGIGAPAPRNDAMPAIPAPDQRAPGSIYETPRGKMKWTGTGWVQP